MARATSLPLVAAAVLLAFALAVIAPAGPALANGTPIRITLQYLNGVSNFGPQNATGTAELITSEGEVRLQAVGLQKLADTEEYAVWISTPNPDDRMRLGAFQANDGGVGRLDIVVQSGIPEKDWDLMVLTVEAKGSQPQTPSEKRAIAGRFSMSPSGGGNAPRVLPNTGGDTPTTGVPPSGLLGLSNGGTILLALLVVGGIGFALGRAGSRRGA
jgi:hypothetical protein